MCADLPYGPEQKLQSEAAYIDARPQSPTSKILLATHGRSIHSGQHRKSAPLSDTSASRHKLPFLCTRLIRQTGLRNYPREKIRPKPTYDGRAHFSVSGW